MFKKTSAGIKYFEIKWWVRHCYHSVNSTPKYLCHFEVYLYGCRTYEFDGQQTGVIPIGFIREKLAEHQKSSHIGTCS